MIIVEWSDLTTDRRWQLLRASLPVGGRAVTLYDDVHPLQKLGNRQVSAHLFAQFAAGDPGGGAAYPGPGCRLSFPLVSSSSG